MTIARGIEESSMVPALLPKRWDAVSPFWCLVLLLLVMNTSCRSGCSGHVAYGYRSIRQDRVTLAADMSLLHFCMICNTTEAWDQTYLQIVLLRTGFTGLHWASLGSISFDVATRRFIQNGYGRVGGVSLSRRLVGGEPGRLTSASVTTHKPNQSIRPHRVGGVLVTGASRWRRNLNCQFSFQH
jgi:hypothetical protein